MFLNLFTWLTQEQSEAFYTINAFWGIRFDNGWPLTMVMGIIFVLAILSWLIDKRKTPSSSAILILISLLWLPFWLNGFYNNTLTLSNSWEILYYNNTDKAIVKICQMYPPLKVDDICVLILFLDDFNKLIPANKSVKILTDENYHSYVKYFLLGRYHLTMSQTEADYLLLFKQADNYFLTQDNQLLRQRQNADKSDLEDLGKYELIKTSVPSGYIFKKVYVNNQNN